MLTRKLLKGETLSSTFLLMKSKSCRNIYKELNLKKKQLKFPITESIYDKFYRLKTNKVKECTKNLRRESQEIKTKHRKSIDSFYSFFLKKRAKSVFNKFYITSFKENEGPSIDLSINSKTSDHLLNSIVQDQIFSIDLRPNHLKMEIGSLFNIPKTALELSHCCRNILFLKNICEIEKKELSEKEKRQITFERNVNEKSFELKEKEQMVKGYHQQIKNYFLFLFSKRDEERLLLNELRNERMTLIFELEKVVIQVSREKMKLDQLINERNFLIKVKEKIFEFPLVFLALIEKESRNNYLFEEIRNLKSKLKIEVIISILQEEKYQKQYEAQVLHYNKNKHKLSQEEIVDYNKQEEKFKKFADKSYLPFEYPEDFITEIKNLERINIVSLSFIQKIKDQADILRHELIKMKEDNKKYDQSIRNLIDTKDKQRQDVFLKYNSLVQLKDKLLKISLFQEKDRLNNSHNKQKKTRVLSSLQSSTLEYLKYKDLQTYIFIKLSEIMTKIINNTNFGKNIGSTYKQEELNILSNMKFKNNNKDSIHSMCIKLLKMFEKGTDIILFNQKEYLNDPFLKEKTLKAVFERQKATKIQNALDQRKCLYEKREIKKDKTITRIQKIIYLPKRKVMKKFCISKKKDNKIKKTLIKEPTFYDYIEYSSDLDSGYY